MDHCSPCHGHSHFDCHRHGHSDCATEANLQFHVHEFVGSVRDAIPFHPHNHRFAGVTQEAILVAGGHVHELEARTDFYDEHYHYINNTTGLDIPVGNRHVHFVTGLTNTEDGHYHEYILGTLIENPTGN